jgi:hypothetical protein
MNMGTFDFIADHWLLATAIVLTLANACINSAAMFTLVKFIRECHPHDRASR